MESANNVSLLSVIVPVYKVEQYLEKCVDSILGQTFKNIEIILVDDGSPDNSGVICDEYAKKDKRVLVIHQKNGGLSAARNAGLKAASGKYIAFVDSDDWIVPEMYEVLYNYAYKYDLDMVKCLVKEVNDLGEGRLLLPKNKAKIEVLTCNERIGSHIKNYFEGVLWTIACNGIYKRDIAMKVLFPEGLCFEDNYTSGMYLFYAQRIMMIDKPLYYYRINQNGISKSRNKRPLDIAIVTLRLIKELEKQGLNDREIFKKLNNKLARELFHFIRDYDIDVFSVKKIDRKIYYWIVKNLDIRRAINFKYLVAKKKIEICRELKSK